MTQSVLLSAVSIPENRQRKEFDGAGLSQLSDSISSVGLINPITVRQTPKGLMLVAGERRYRACENIFLMGGSVRYGGRELSPGHIPVNDILDLPADEAAELELEENIIRVDLTWQERTQAEASLVELRRMKAERAGVSVSMVEIGTSVFPEMHPKAAGQTVRKSTVLAAAMVTNPDVAKAKSKDDAWKIIQRAEQARIDILKGEEIGREKASSLHRVLQADCRDYLRGISGEFDCILIDPPYGMSADEFGDAAGKRTGIEHGYEDGADAADLLMREVAPLLFEAGKPESHLYVWCDLDHYTEWRAIFTLAGWWVHRTPLINVKREGGRVPWPEHGPRRCYELVLYAVKGKRPITGIYRDVFESTLERSTDGHGAAKPVEAYIDLLRRSCRPGDSVLDCFAGTGTILAAAHHLKLRATAVEKDPAYYGQILRKLEALK